MYAFSGRINIEHASITKYLTVGHKYLFFNLETGEIILPNGAGEETIAFIGNEQGCYSSAFRMQEDSSNAFDFLVNKDEFILTSSHKLVVEGHIIDAHNSSYGDNLGYINHNLVFIDNTDDSFVLEDEHYSGSLSHITFGLKGSRYKLTFTKNDYTLREL